MLRLYNSKTTSCWFHISEEITEDVRKCVNVKEIESQGNLCALCRRNLTRCHKGPTNACKYFTSVNSRGQPCINRSTVARKKLQDCDIARHLAFPTVFASCNFARGVVFPYRWVSYWSDVSRLRQTCRYADQICQFNILWKVSLQREIPEQLCHLHETVLSNSFLSYKVLFNSKCRWEGHHAAISYHVKELA